MKKQADSAHITSMFKALNTACYSVDGKDVRRRKRDPMRLWMPVTDILTLYPHTAGAVDKNMKLPLHICCLEHAPMPVIEMLVELHPDGVRGEDNCSMLPLHAAVWKPDAPVALLQLLVTRHPEGLQCEDNQRRMPLHWAAERGAGDEAVRFLVGAHYEAAAHRDTYGKTPLHLAAERRAPAPVLRTLLAAHSAAASEADAEGRLPLHHAVLSRLHADGLQKILAAYPGAAEREESAKSGKLPLHLACEVGFAAPFCEQLVAAHAPACRRADTASRVPLHYAVSCAALDLSVLQLLLDTCPAAALHQDSHRRTPLNHAIVNRCPLDKVALVVAACPECLSVPDDDGRLPLHNALITGGGQPLIELLSRAFPDATKHQDRDRRTPMHWALLHKHACAVVQPLLEMNTLACQVKDVSSKMPLRICKDMVLGRDIFEILFREYPPANKEPGMREPAPAVDKDAAQQFSWAATHIHPCHTRAYASAK
jgi:ankyrin repeat protein